MSDEPDGALLPRSIEQLLAAAANDPVFRAELLQDRLGAASQRGFELSDAERAIFEAVPTAQLVSTLDRLDRGSGFNPQPRTPDGPLLPAGIRPHGGRRRGVLLAAAAAVTGAAVGGAYLCSAGVQPDRPEPAKVQGADAGVDAADDATDVTSKP